MLLFKTPNLMPVPQKALLIDDEPHVRMYVKLILVGLGVNEVIEAKNGKLGLEAYQAHEPDLVVMDVNMPEMDGLTALAKLQEIDPEAIVIMMTSLASREVVETAANSGAVEYIRKDLPRSEVTELFRRAFEELFDE